MVGASPLGVFKEAMNTARRAAVGQPSGPTAADKSRGGDRSDARMLHADGNFRERAPGQRHRLEIERHLAVVRKSMNTNGDEPGPLRRPGK
jgi:hypothetical protein